MKNATVNNTGVQLTRYKTYVVELSVQMP